MSAPNRHLRGLLQPPERSALAREAKGRSEDIIHTGERQAKVAIRQLGELSFNRVEPFPILPGIACRPILKDRLTLSTCSATLPVGSVAEPAK